MTKMAISQIQKYGQSNRERNIFISFPNDNSSRILLPGEMSSLPCRNKKFGYIQFVLLSWITSCDILLLQFFY